MKTNSFNICPTCVHRDSCVLTTQKSKVWSCSEYDETNLEFVAKPKPTNLLNKNHLPEIAMA